MIISPPNVEESTRERSIMMPDKLDFMKTYQICRNLQSFPGAGFKENHTRLAVL
jgi:hypothetical protein